MAVNGILDRINKMAIKDDRVSVIHEKVDLPLSKIRIKKLAGRILSELKEKNARVCIFFVSDAKMRELNLKYRKINRPTDCLAFPMREGKMLGDIAISMDTAKINSRYFDSTVKKEITLYMVHGILHLLGFKDTTPSGKKRMRRMEEEIINRLGGF